MSRVRPSILLSALLLLGLATPPLEAQGGARPIRVTATRALAFGSLFTGYAFTVSPADPIRSAAFDLSGPNRTTVELQFVLPAALVGPGGATMPLSFLGNAAGFATQSQGQMRLFDPTTPQSATLSSNGRGFVYLGGTITPAALQRSGSYSGTVILYVAVTGL